MEYTFEKRTVFFNKAPIYHTPGDITCITPFNDNLIVHYDVASQAINRLPSEEIYRNVLSIDFNGNVLWRLPMPPEHRFPKFQPDYASIRCDDEGNFWAFDGGYINKFEPETGKIIERIFTK